MPGIRTYTVTQERELKIMAESPADAIRLSEVHFSASVDNTAEELKKPEITSVQARKDY